MNNFDFEFLISALSMPREQAPSSGLRSDIPNRPRVRPIELEGPGKTAAVMLLIFGEPNQDSRLVFTRRNSKLKNHAGQISFPGGRQDHGEELQDTAVRETEEEIGIRRHDIRIAGALDSVYIPPSDFTIHPFVGCYAGFPHFKKSDEEVAEVIDASINHLLEPETLKFGEVQAPGGPVDVDYYDVDGHQIWGATAIVLNEFLRRLKANFERTF